MARTGSTSKPAAPTDTTGSSRIFILAVIGIVVVGLAAIAVAATRSDSADDTTAEQAVAQTAAVQLDGNLPAMPPGVTVSDASSDPAVGTVAPSLVGTGFDGAEVTVAPDGSAKVIYFLAHWCPHCQAEVPIVQQLLDDGRKPDGVDIYAISTAVDDGRGNYPPQAWLDDEGLSVPIIRDDDAVSALSGFGGAGFPYVVYLDADHQVVARSSGSLDADTIERLWQSTIDG